MRDQDRKIQRSNASAPCKRHRSHLIVIHQIRHQKEGGGPKGRPHTEFVRSNLSLSDQQVAEAQQKRAGPIEYGIDCRQDGNWEDDYVS